MADPLPSNESSSSSPFPYPLSSYDRPPIRGDEYRILWCLILGDRQPFKVSVPFDIDVDIDDLKQVIHIKGINTTRHTVFPKNLILW